MQISLELQPILKSKSGIGWYTFNIIKQLNNREYNLIGEGFNFLSRNDVENELRDINIETVFCKLIPYGIYKRIWNYIPIKYNTLFKSKSDIYHFFNFIVPPKIDGKVIVTVYDMVYKKIPETMTKANYKRLNKNLKRSVDRADIIITISENSKQEIIEYLNVPESKIRIVPPGVDLNVYNKDYAVDEMEMIKEKYKLPDRYFLYLGTLEPRKNIEAIVEAFALYKKQNNDNIKLVLAGKKGWMYESIFEKIKNNNIENEVVFTDYVDENDKVLIYKMSEVFLFPSLYEGFGMPVLEAMACGVPVITSNTSSLPEVSGDACILVEPKDVNSMVAAMKSIVLDEEYKNSLIKKGLEQSKKFTWEKSSQKLVKIYKELGEK